jgi:gamma-glutamyl-gamma-aminobutyrate hydrolase PuuD
MKNVVYSAVFGNDAYPFTDLGKQVVTARTKEDLVDPDSYLIIWGGADISPTLYNHPQSRRTHCYHGRDAQEWSLLNRAVDMGIPVIGVCRGAQMLCAKAGGFLIQDVTKHAGYGHNVTTADGRSFPVNSIHHQMMGGYEELDHELLAWSSEKRSDGYIWKDDQTYTPPEGFVEAEFIYFPKIKGFAIQWHPEGMAENSRATQYVMEKLYEYA